MNRMKMDAVEPQLQSHVSAPERNSSLRWVIGLAAAAAAAATVGCASLTSIPGEVLTGPSPGPTQDSAEAADLAAAQGVADAFVSHDPGAAEQYLAPGAELWEGWSRHWERDAAWSVEVLMEPCTGQPIGSVGTNVTCPFAMHVMGSREVGAGPFTENTLTIRVKDGKVISAHREIPFAANGIGQQFDAVYAWLDGNHPDDVALLEMDELEIPEDEWPEWLELWKQHLAEYIAANKAG